MEQGSSAPQASSPDIAPPASSEIAPEAGAASTPSGGWLKNALNALVGRNEVPGLSAPRGSDEQAAGERSSDETEAWSPPSWTRKEDYEQWLQSQQQSFADRRDRERERRSVAEQERSRDDRVAALEDEKQAARADGNTWRVGEIQDEIDALVAGVKAEDMQSGALHEFMGALRAENDAITLDLLLKELPEKQITDLIDKASWRDESGALVMAPDGQPAGVVTAEQRAALFSTALKAVKDAAKAEGRAEARKDPVLRKEMMAGFKATPEADEQEPVTVSDAAHGAGPSDMNAFLRSVRGSRNGR